MSQHDHDAGEEQIARLAQGAIAAAAAAGEQFARAEERRARAAQAATEEQARAAVQSTVARPTPPSLDPPGPVFEVYEMRNEADDTRRLSKQEALSTIESVGRISPEDVARRRDNGYDPVHYMQNWIGQDVDVDRAILATLPDLMTEQQRQRLHAATATASADVPVEPPAAEPPEETAAEAGDRARMVDRSEAADGAQVAATEGASERAEGIADHDPSEVRAGEATEVRESDTAVDLRTEASIAYDSAERRADMAAAMTGIEPEIVDARMRADVAQAAPAADATITQRAARARKGPRLGVGAGKERELSR